MTAPTLAPIALGLALLAGLIRAALRTDAKHRARSLRREAWRLPARTRTFVAVRLARAELALEPETAMRWWLGVVGAFAWCALVVAPGLLLPAIAAAACSGPIALRLRVGRADRAARAALPGVLDQVVAHLRAGGTVADAVDALATRSGPLAMDFRRVRARLALGASIEQSLGAWQLERPVEGVGAAAGALAMVTVVGGSAATPLEGLAVSLRNDDAAAGEARALSAQARISALVVGAAPLAFLLFSSVTNPASVQILVGSTTGRICLVLGLGLEAMAAWWMHRLVGLPR